MRYNLLFILIVFSLCFIKGAFQVGGRMKWIYLIAFEYLIVISELHSLLVIVHCYIVDLSGAVISPIAWSLSALPLAFALVLLFAFAVDISLKP